MSTVIKSGGSTRHIQHIAFNLEDMKQQAARYLEQVRSQAAQIIAAAKAEADGIRKRAEEEGKQAALRAAEKVLDDKVGQRMQTTMPALQKVVAGIADAKQDWLAHWERTAVHLAAAMAARVVRRQIPHLPDVTLTLVREGLEMAAGSSRIRIRLHPTDHDTLKGQIERLTHELERLGPAELIADPQISPGGCRIEMAHGAIDQQFESQLARIEEELARGNES
ncbi:MAG TPA: FliH/SctL family protein [Pirellulales bacterium]|jgi:flagellar biosynthesis/type III secretory pathway protein FliH